MAGFFSYILEGAESRLPIPDGRLDANRRAPIHSTDLYLAGHERVAGSIVLLTPHRVDNRLEISLPIHRYYMISTNQ